MSLGRDPGPFLFVAMKGTGELNNFTLDTTVEDTSIATMLCKVAEGLERISNRPNLTHTMQILQ